MSRAKRFARTAGKWLLNTFTVAACAVMFIFLLLIALDEPLEHGPTLQFSEACYGRGI